MSDTLLLPEKLPALRRVLSGKMVPTGIGFQAKLPPGEHLPVVTIDDPCSRWLNPGSTEPSE